MLKIRLWHYPSIFIILLVAVLSIFAPIISNAVSCADLRHIPIRELSVSTRVLIALPLIMHFIPALNSYLGFIILRHAIIQNGYDLLLNGSQLILLQISKIRGYIPILSLLFSFPSLLYLGLNFTLVALHSFNRGYVVSSGIIPSY